MCNLCSLVLLTGLTVVSRVGPEKTQPAMPAVVKGPIVLFMVIPNNSGTRIYEAPATVTTLAEGLPYARKASRDPILAMSESANWFYYATFVGRDGYDRPQGVFVEGFKIRRGGRQVIPCQSGW
jgi:hypothetical protein